MKAIEEQLARLASELRDTMERLLRQANFGPKNWTLPQPRVCVMEPKRSRLIRGWHSPRRWKQGVVKLDEVVLTPASVSKGVFHAAEVVAHELVHLANAVAGRQDTSRQGRYHNDHFRRAAEAMGLEVAQDEVHGWCRTELGAELSKQIRELIERGVLHPHAFKYQRRLGPLAKASLVKLSAACGVFAYVTRSNAATILRCGHCGEILSPSDE